MKFIRRLETRRGDERFYRDPSHLYGHGLHSRDIWRDFFLGGGFWNSVRLSCPSTLCYRLHSELFFIWWSRVACLLSMYFEGCGEHATYTATVLPVKLLPHWLMHLHLRVFLFWIPRDFCSADILHYKLTKKPSPKRVRHENNTTWSLQKSKKGLPIFLSVEWVRLSFHQHSEPLMYFLNCSH